MQRTLRAIVVLFAGASILSAQQRNAPGVIFTPFSDSEPVLRAEAEALPEGLKGHLLAELETIWPIWVERRNAEIRARLAQGEEDTIVNFLLFGTSFTQQPRVTAQDLNSVYNQEAAGHPQNEKSIAVQKVLAARLNDLVLGAANPGENERLQFARSVLSRKGHNLSTPAGHRYAEAYLRTSLARILKQASSYAEVLRSARSLGDATEEFVQRSTLFHNRGLSLDTSWPVNFALEDSLATLKAQGLLTANSIRSVAIVGPGLDFTDKQEGYDFYPQQTIQPFAIFDSLLRLGLAREESLTITALDISRRVNAHLVRARERAMRGKGYVVQLPLDPNAQWTSDALAYWQRLGDRIGTPTAPAAVPSALQALKVRAVSIPPPIVRRVTPVDLNIVLQKLDMDSAHRFDLIIATNIFVYYDTFEQSVALTNVSHMLKPGGLLLSNNVLLELPSSAVHAVGHKTTVYSDRSNDGDHIVWYRLAQGAPK